MLTSEPEAGAAASAAEGVGGDRTAAALRDLRASVAGAAVTAGADLEPFGYDFGGGDVRPPLAVLQARTEEDVVRALRVARRHGVPVTVRGAGHSCRGQSLCPGGIVVATRATAPRLRLLGGDRVEVSAGTCWADLERALGAAGRDAHVLTNHTQTTVGGTLAAGGYGVRSLRYGAQVDHVERMRLLRPDGTALWCSATEHPDLFRLSLTGFGQLGLIQTVVLRTLPHRPWLRLQQNDYASLTELVDAIAWTAEWTGEAPDQFFAELVDGRVRSSFGTGHAGRRDAVFSAAAPLRAMAGGQVHVVPRAPAAAAPAEAVPHDRRFRHLWADYGLTFAALRAFVGFVDAGLRAETLATNLSRVYLLCLRRPPPGAVWPFDVRRVAGTDPVVYGVGLYYRVPLADAAGVASARAALRAALTTCLALGGRPYLYGWHELDAEGLDRVYGADYRRLLDLRRRADPLGLFNRGAL